MRGNYKHTRKRRAPQLVGYWRYWWRRRPQTGRGHAGRPGRLPVQDDIEVSVPSTSILEGLRRDRHPAMDEYTRKDLPAAELARQGC